MAIEPKCPSCNVQGMQYIIASDSTAKSNSGDVWFNIALCSECGHVYGVFAKIVYVPTNAPFRLPLSRP